MNVLKALTIDFEHVIQSMRDLARETADYYLDKDTGQVISLSRDLIRFLEDEDHRDRPEIPEWDARMIPLAREMVLSGATKFVRIPEAFGRSEQQWMHQFTEDVRSAKLRQKMQTALKGRGACHRFKALLTEFPEEQRQWKTFRTHCWEVKIQLWLESHGILAVNGHPARPKVIPS